MKRVVLNRKNSLFVGNPRGGRTAAILSSLTSTCRRHDIDPQLYFTQLLINLPSLSIRQLLQWLPDQWKIRHNACMENLHNPSLQPAWEWGSRTAHDRIAAGVRCSAGSFDQTLNAVCARRKIRSMFLSVLSFDLRFSGSPS